MIWNDHRYLQGQHAFLGASKPQWIKWDDQTLIKRFNTSHAADVGTAIHALAKDLIEARMVITENDEHLIDMTIFKNVRKAYPNGYDKVAILTNLIPYVRDAIGFRMSPEVILYYSDNCFGTTDAISFDEKEKILRISDLKTGTMPVHEEQLFIYDALFCIEYGRDPRKIKFENRFYQNGKITLFTPDSSLIKNFMDIAIKDNTKIEEYLRLAEIER